SVMMPASLALPATSLFWAEGSPSAQQSARNKPQPTTNREQLQACLALPRCEGGKQSQNRKK
ncbi:MAG: hypothetical protein KBT06_11265, partial [Prevotellaceae bacterium]|nr:hypothetical protein [Candidatus Colivivens equi]